MMRGDKWILIILCIFFSVSFVSAQSTCNENQKIFRLSSDHNAHGELYAGTEVGFIDICYNNVFGGITFNSEGDPHICSGSNVVLTMSSDGNAHGEGPLENNYVVDVCYGDLECTIRELGCRVSDGERMVVSLSGVNNAHLSTGFIYPQHICCKSQASGITDPPVICTDDDDGDGYYEEGGVCGAIDCDDDPLSGGAINPGADEICDGIDNNCNLAIDEGCECSPIGDTKQCGNNNGECEFGTQTCTATGWGEVCEGAIGPIEEICGDGLDNNCNGEIDDANLCVDPPTICNNGDTRNCPLQKGVCAGTIETCVEENWPGCNEANYGINYEGIEVSCEDGKDNDCDGDTDLDDSNCEAPLEPRAWWARMNDEEMPAGSDMFIGNSVKLKVEGITNENDLEIKIYDEDPGLLPDNLIKTVTISKNNIISGKAEYIWREITQEEYDRGGFEPDNILELYFITNPRGPKVGVIKLHNSVRNIAPFAVIDTPEDGGISLINVPIQFSHSSYDLDGEIVKVLWTIEDGGTTITRSENSFTHPFSTTGQKNIKLKVTDNGGKSDEAQVSILIFGPGSNEKDQILAFIDTPEHQEIVRKNDLIVDYKGIGSYVVSSTFNTGNDCPSSVDCLAGGCPENVNVGGTCGLIIPIGGSGRGHYDDLNFQWTFYSDKGGSFGRTTGGLGVKEGRQQFGKASESIDDKWIILKLEHAVVPVLNGEITRIFTLLLNQGNTACLGSALVDLDENNNIISVRNVNTDTGDPENDIAPACAGPDSIAGNGDDCRCLNGLQCFNEGENRGCQEPEINGCVQFDTPVLCEDNRENINAIQGDPLYEYLGCNIAELEDGTIIKCECQWNIDDDKCELNKLTTPPVPPNIDPGSIGDICPSPGCTVHSEDSFECVQGVYNINVIARFLRPNTIDPIPEWCEEFYEEEELKCNNNAGPEKINCLSRPTIQLPFFGILQFGIAVGLMMVIYILIFFRKWKKEELY